MRTSICLKCLTFIAVLFLGIEENTFAAINSSGSSVFTSAPGTLQLWGFTQTEYPSCNPVGGACTNPDYPLNIAPFPPSYVEPVFPVPNFSAASGVKQVQWGQSPYEDAADNPGAVSAYTLTNTPDVPVTLGSLFDVTDVTLYNQKIVGSFINGFAIQLTVELNIDGFLKTLTFNNLIVQHQELPNPAVDITTWLSPPSSQSFSANGVDYTLTVLGFSESLQVECPGRCFIVRETDNPFDDASLRFRTVPIQAILTGVAVPEPASYLLMGGALAAVMVGSALRRKRVKEQCRERSSSGREKK